MVSTRSGPCLSLWPHLPSLSLAPTSLKHWFSSSSSVTPSSFLPYTRGPFYLKHFFYRPLHEPHHLELNSKTILHWDFPGGAVVKNPPANAGDTGSSPGPWRSHMPWSNEARAPQLLSPRTTTTEAGMPRAPVLLNKEKPPQWEACALQRRVVPTCHN